MAEKRKSNYTTYVRVLGRQEKPKTLLIYSFIVSHLRRNHASNTIVDNNDIDKIE